MSASSTSFSPDQLQQQQHHLSPSDQLCYVHCNFCDTVLAVISFSTQIITVFSFNFHYFSCYFFFFLLVLCLGECSLHQFVQDCHCEMRPLLQPSLCEHAWAASSCCKSTSPCSLLLHSSKYSGIITYLYS